MPEGPETRLAADRIAKAIQGRAADEVFFAFESLQPFRKKLTGQQVERIDTRGKAMLTRFSGGLSVYTHNQLYGRWYIMGDGKMPRTQRQLRFSVRAGDQRALLYSASDIEVLTPAQEASHPFLGRLGPDLLSESPPPAEIANRIEDSRFRGRQLGALLLDQSFVAGLGNYLRAEILFEARIHPRCRGKDCTAEERQQIAQQIVSVTRRAYRTRGITLAEEHVTALKKKGVKRSAYRHWVYDRRGLPCRRCETQVVTENIGGRNCFWCPQCQPVGD